MTPAKQAKALGLKSLAQVSALTGVSLQTLDNWSKNKPKLFKTVLHGCIFEQTVGNWYDNLIGDSDDVR